MKRIVLLFFVHLSQAYVNLEQCILDHRSNKNIWEERLNDKIMCNYYADKPPKPLNGSDAILVNTHFIVKSFRFWSEDQEFSVFTWATISWKDERLKWDPTDYDGIDETVKDSYKLWLPGIKLYNSISDLYDQSRSNNAHPFMLCRITSNGKIMCVSSVTFEAKCATDLNDWPFDTQVCSLEFGPWAVVGTKIRLDVDYGGISFIGSEYGGDWDIMDFRQEENQDAERQIKFFFTMTRHAEGLAAIVIFPSILLSALTLSTLFVDVRHVSRVYVACFSLACHFYFLSELGMNIPEHSKRSPRILLYFRGSVIMTIISVVLTCLMKFLCEREEPVPNMIAIVNENVYKTYAKLVIRPRWEAAKADGKRELAEAWIDFVNILNSLWLYVSLFAYIIMCCVFIPSPNGLKQKIYSMSYEFD